LRQHPRLDRRATGLRQPTAFRQPTVFRRQPTAFREVTVPPLGLVRGLVSILVSGFVELAGVAEEEPLFARLGKVVGLQGVFEDGPNLVFGLQIRRNLQRVPVTPRPRFWGYNPV